MLLDIKDRKILHELGDNARISCSALAKKIRLSREVTKYRLKRLTDEKYIKWFTIVIDTARIGYNTYQFYIQLEKTTEKKEEEIIDFLREDKRVNYLCVISGNWDIMCECYARNPQELFEFMSSIRSKFSSNIKKIDSTTIIKECICINKNVIIEEKMKYSHIEHNRFMNNNMELDAKEKAILFHLSNNCRMMYVDIADRIGASVDYVKYKIMQMTDDGLIASFKPIYDFTKLGFQQYIILYQLEASYEETMRLISYLKIRPNIVYVMQSIGKWDLSIVINVRNPDEFRKVLIEIRNDFTNIIKEETSLLMHEELKNNYLPPSCYPAAPK
ncbi:MAG: Lrp/AsnC family transcriptional regulator [Candidatus Woesearchaeota archaeon]|nr:Lrp/AsnC family transcriptional regulator [Candidatus Woesearchaeota archaeon]